MINLFQVMWLLDHHASRLSVSRAPRKSRNVGVNEKPLCLWGKSISSTSNLMSFSNLISLNSKLQKIYFEYLEGSLWYAYRNCCQSSLSFNTFLPRGPSKLRSRGPRPDFTFPPCEAQPFSRLSGPFWVGWVKQQKLI